MKKIITLIAVFGLILLSSCEGPQGPPGFDGQNGKDGLISEVFEVINISFNSTNNYAKLIPLTPAIHSSDMVLVYRLSGVTTQGADIWKSLPETYYFNDGTRDFDYNFDFTINDVNIFLEGNNLATVANAFKTNQVFRIVILPGYLTTAKKSTKKVDLSDYNAVIKAYNINDTNVKVLN